MTDQQNPYSAAPYASQQQQQQQQYAAPAPGFSPQQAPARPSMWAAFGPGRNVPGLLSLLAAVAAFVIDSVFTVIIPLLYRSGGYVFAEGIGFARVGFGVVLGLAAVGLGIAALLSRNPSKWPAIAGTAVGLFALISLIVGAISNVFYSFV